MTTNSEPVSSSHSSKAPRYFRWFREVAAIGTWILGLVHVFFHDLGLILPTSSEYIRTAYEFRFLILPTLALGFWLILGTKKFLLSVAYILLYPIIALALYLPRVLFRNWTLVIAFYPAFFEVVRSLRSHILFATVSLISTFVILESQNRIAVAIAALMLLTHLVRHFCRRLQVAYAPKTAFKTLQGMIDHIAAHFENYRSWSQADKHGAGTEEYDSAQSANLIMMYTSTLIFFLFSDRFRSVVESRKIDVYFMSSIVYTLCFTVLVFSLMFFAVDHVWPDSFSGENASYLDFLGLSASRVFSAGLSPLCAETALSKVLLYSETISSYLIALLLGFITFTTVRERHKEDLDAVVDELGRAAERTRAVLQRDFTMTLAAVRSLLVSENPELAQWTEKLVTQSGRKQLELDLAAACETGPRKEEGVIGSEADTR